MRKRKLLLTLLTAVLAFVLLPAYAIELPSSLMDLLGGGDQATAEFELIEDNLLVYDSALGRNPYYVAAVENKSDVLASVQKVVLHLLDAEGKEVATTDAYGSVPRIVAPGETSYINMTYIRVEEELLSKVASWTLEVEGMAAYAPAADPTLPTKVELVEGTQRNYLTDQDQRTITLLTEVTNNTDAVTFDPLVFVVVRDAAGKLVAARESWGMDVGIPVGAHIVVRSALEPDLIAALTAEGLAPAAAEALAFYEAPYEYDE